MEGVPIKIGSVTYKVPDPTMEAAESVLLKLEHMAKTPMSGAQAMQAIAEIIQALLLENYPDITLRDLKRSIKATKATEVMMAVVKAAGMEAKVEGEAVTP